MEFNYNLTFEELSSELKELIYGVIEEICGNVEKYNINMQDLSREVGMEYDQLMDYMVHPKNDYSGYLDILEAINRLLGR